MTLPVATRLGPYEILGTLGAGGVGEVYKARDARIDRSVAIKILPQGTSRTNEAESRFEREARALAALSHPCICSLFEFTRIDGEALLIMEYLEGQLLSERLMKGRLPLPEALRIAVEMADGLAAAQRAGLVHRDLSRQCHADEGGIKLLDFGLAKVAARDDLSGGDAATRQDLTPTGIVFGTVPFMAPEQLDGRPVDHRAGIGVRRRASAVARRRPRVVLHRPRRFDDVSRYHDESEI